MPMHPSPSAETSREPSLRVFIPYSNLCRYRLELPDALAAKPEESQGRRETMTWMEPVELTIGDRTIRISNPDRVYFSARGETKLDLVNYYISVGEGIVRALYERPCMLHRFPEGRR